MRRAFNPAARGAMARRGPARAPVARGPMPRR